MLLQYAWQHLPRNSGGGGERERDREGEGKMLISQQLKADKQGGAQRKITDACCDPQLQSGNKASHFSHHLHQKELLPYLSRPILLHHDLSSGALNDGPGVDMCVEGLFSTV